TGVAKHVEVDRKWHLGGFADALDQAMEADGTDWPAALGNEYVSPFGVLAAQLTQSPHLVTPDGMHAGLRARRERPHRRRTADQRDELAALDAPLGHSLQGVNFHYFNRGLRDLEMRAPFE